MSPVLSLTLRLQVEEGAQEHIPGAEAQRAPSPRFALHAHTGELRGHQRSSHRAILPRTENKDILDSGSKSQPANGEQRETCCLRDEWSPSPIRLEGTYIIKKGA